MTHKTADDYIQREEALRERLIPFRDEIPLRMTRRIPDNSSDLELRRRVSRRAKNDDSWEVFVASAGTWWGRYTEEHRLPIQQGIWGLLYINYLTGRIDSMDECEISVLDVKQRRKIADIILWKFERVFRRVDERLSTQYVIPIRFYFAFELWEVLSPPAPISSLFFPIPPRQHVVREEHPRRPIFPIFSR